MTSDEFLAAALRNPVNRVIAEKLLDLMLPDAWVVSGCVVQSVWNVLTSRAVDYGIADYDVFYFDPDISWEAEDAVLRHLQGAFENFGVVVEARNQARVHLVWRKVWPALPAAAVVGRRHRPVSDQEHASRNPPLAGGF